jgi:hypothetical protein
MFRTRFRRRLASIAFRAAALVALGGFVASITGVPLPVVTSGKQASRPTAGASRGCCCRLASQGAGKCCGSCGCSKAKPDADGAADAPQVEYVLSIQARKCQGQAEIWLALGAVSPPPEHVQIAHDLPFCGQLMYAGISFNSLTLVPATPPPRA